jgi:transposase-like protein
MKASMNVIQKRRRYTEEYKRSIVKDFESGKYSVLQLERLHSIRHSLIYKWIYKYSTFNDKSFQVVEMKESNTSKIKELEKKVKELERAVGQKQLYIDYMEKMMELAKDELGVDIKKNFDTPQSAGSEKTKKK